MKNLTPILIGILLIYASIGCFALIEAATWKDDFHVAKKERWELVGEDSTWKVQDGFLSAEMRAEKEAQHELLQFKTAPGPYHNFTLTVENIGSEQANFGIALGKKLPDKFSNTPFFYLFLSSRIEARRFSGTGGVRPFLPHHVPRHPDTDWGTPKLKQMELHFNAGHFQCFADGELRADFHDPGFSPIEIIGFVIQGTNLHVGKAWVDAFTISGPSLPVSPRAKLATTWARLKKQR